VYLDHLGYRANVHWSRSYVSFRCKKPWLDNPGNTGSQTFFDGMSSVSGSAPSRTSLNKVVRTVALACLRIMTGLRRLKLGGSTNPSSIFRGSLKYARSWAGRATLGQVQRHAELSPSPPGPLPVVGGSGGMFRMSTASRAPMLTPISTDRGANQGIYPLRCRS